MTAKNKLRHNLIRRIQQLSPEKLDEVTKFLSKVDRQLKSKETTLKLAGSWKDLDSEVFNDLTINLHENRINDRKIL